MQGSVNGGKKTSIIGFKLEVAAGFKINVKCNFYFSLNRESTSRPTTYQIFKKMVYSNMKGPVRLGIQLYTLDSKVGPTWFVVGPTW